MQLPTLGGWEISTGQNAVTVCHWQ